MKIAHFEIDFKPEFGNLQHIRVIDMIKSINADHKELVKKEEAKKDAAALKKRIGSQVAELKKYLKFIKK